MSKLVDNLELITQRTSQSFDLTSGQSRNRFITSIRTDIAAVVEQLNNVYYPLVNRLIQIDTIDGLEEGIAGTVIYTDPEATSTSASAYYDTATSRPRSIKESFDVILTNLAALQNITVTATQEDWEEEAAELAEDIALNTLNIQQVAKDAFGTNYTLDNDGAADLTHSLSRHIDNIGAFFTGFPGTGNTYGGSYPTLTLAILLSQITIDTTLAQSVITDLTTHLGNIRSFMGMGTVGPESPTYSAHGALTYVADGETLEEAIQTLDQAITSGSLGAFVTASNVTSNSPGTLATDDFVFGSAQLNDSGTAAHDRRMLFDKSAGAFRAGIANSTEWDASARGSGSAAFGINNTAAADNAFAAGNTNTVASTSTDGAIVGGESHVLARALRGAILGGEGNSIGDIGADNENNVITGGLDNSLTGASDECAIVSGRENAISGSIQSVIVGGFTNEISGAASNSGVFAGTGAEISGGGDNCTVLGGDSALITGSGNNNTVVGGTGGQIDASGDYNTTVGIEGGIISGASNGNLLIGGVNNQIDAGDYNVAIGGSGTVIDSGADNCVTLGATDSSVTVDNCVVTGAGASAYLPGSFVQAKSPFPGDATGLLGQAQSGKLLLMMENDGSGLQTLTTDGGAATTANVLFIPENTVVYAIAHYAILLGDASATAGGAGGTTIALISRHTGAAVIEGLVYNESKSDTNTNNITLFGLGGTYGTSTAGSNFIVSALGDGYVEFEVDLSPGVGVTARAVASVEWIQVRGSF